MIGGLIKQEDFRAAEESTGERDTHAPPTGELAAGFGLDFVRVEAETDEDSRST